MTTTILSQPVRTKNGNYIIDGWKINTATGDGFALIRNVGWCEFCEFTRQLGAVLIPNVGWVATP